MECLECQQDFDNQKSLHLHLKKHGGVAHYYQKHFPKKDLLTGQIIDFKNKDQYLSAIFNNNENRSIYLTKCSEEDGQNVIESEYSKELNGKQFGFFPSTNYIELSDLPSIKEILKFYKTCRSFCEALNIKQIYEKRLPKSFNFKSGDDFNILIDTREQKPFVFNNSIISKLDFGDYTAGGDYYSQTFVDRKSLTDFKGTFGVGIERFKKEIERCEKFNSFLFIVVESSIENIKRQNEKSKFKTNLNYAFHNVRELLRDYPNTVQFAFCNDRTHAAKITEKILLSGKSVWNCDLQHYINHGTI